mgnify:CR=1 FL=1
MILEITIGAILAYVIVCDGVTRGMLRAWKIRDKAAAKTVQAAVSPRKA